MSNIESFAESEILNLAKEFEKNDIQDIVAHLNLLSDNDKEPVKIKSPDIVYNKLVETVINKYNDYFQTYKVAPLYSQIVSNIENYIFDSCENTMSIIKDINTLSEITYESSLCSGNLALNLFSDKIEFLVEFEKNDYQTDIVFDKQGLRYLRKLLQIAQKDLCLVLNKNREKWTPVGYVLKEHCSLPVFTIDGPLCWTFTVANEFVTFSRGKFVVRDKLEQTLSTEIIQKLCENLDGVDETTIKNVIESIKNDKDVHGALLVFVDDEQLQAVDNLCQHKRGIKIHNSATTDLQNGSFLYQSLVDMCKIDGAVVFDKRGHLLSIGTILDGRVISDGDVGRGSRYNSTKTFVEFYSQPQKEWTKIITSQKENLNCVGLVISEDGYVNLICKDKVFSGNLWTS